MHHLCFDFTCVASVEQEEVCVCGEKIKPMTQFPSSRIKSVNPASLCLSHVQIERRLELVRLVSHNTHKRLVSCLQSQLGTDAEKRQVRSTLSPPCHPPPPPPLHIFHSLYLILSAQHDTFFANYNVEFMHKLNWRADHCNASVSTSRDLLSCAGNT